MRRNGFRFCAEVILRSMRPATVRRLLAAQEAGIAVREVDTQLKSINGAAGLDVGVARCSGSDGGAQRIYRVAAQDASSQCKQRHAGRARLLSWHMR